jgi:hypothetical protein
MAENIINKFLQLDNPDIARQTRNMSYGDAFKTENPFSKSYQGYRPGYTGADKVGLGGYVKQGINSLTGNFQQGSNVGGATPLTRKLAQDTMRFAPKALGVGSGILRTLASLPMQATMAGPYAISKAMGPSVAAGDFVNDEQFQLGQSEVGVGDFYSGKTNLLSDAEKAMMADQYDVGYSFADNERITPNIPGNVPSNFVDAGRDFSMFDQARMGDAVSGTNVQSENYNMDQSFYMNPNSVERPQNMFERFGGAMQDGLESLRNKAGSIADYLPLGNKSLSGMVMRGAGKVAKGIGNFFQGDSTFGKTLSNSRKENNTLQSLGLDGVGNFGGFTTDDLGRVVNTGDYITPENIMSGYNAGFDLAGSALGRIGTIQNAIGKGRFKDKFALDRANKKIDALKTAAVASAQAKRQAYQDKIDRAKNEAAANRARAKSISQGYGGHDDSPGATGPTAAGAGMGYGGGYQTDHGFKKDGGMIGYRDGGLASMFVRRR